MEKFWTKLYEISQYLRFFFGIYILRFEIMPFFNLAHAWFPHHFQKARTDAPASLTYYFLVFIFSIYWQCKKVLLWRPQLVPETKINYCNFLRCFFHFSKIRVHFNFLRFSTEKTWNLFEKVSNWNYAITTIKRKRDVDDFYCRAPMTLSIMTFIIMTFSIMTFSIMTFSIMTFSIMTFSIMSFSIMTFSNMTLSITIHKLQHSA